MKVITVKADNLTPKPSNARKHPETQLKEIVRSLKMFGQTRPVIIDENNVILAGHGFVEAAKMAGEVSVKAVRMEGLSESDKKKLMLSDNKTSDMGFDDYDKLLETIKSLDDFELPGFDAESLNDLLVDTEKAVSEYGVIPEADPTDGPGFADFQSRPDGWQKPVSADAEDPDEEGSGSKTEVSSERTVLCPNCGEKIRI